MCSRCIYDSSVSGIYFDEQGVCNYCHQIEKLEQDYGTGLKKGEEALEKIIDEIKQAGSGKKYDCIVGVSGGTDSSYLLMKCVDWGLRPLAVHYDNTWNTAVSTENIRAVTKALGVDLHTHVLDNREADDLKRAILLAGVPEFDADTDIAFVQVLRSAAARYRVKYILEGHSFRAEGVSPIGSNYFDGAYVKDIHRRFGSGVRLKTFPNLTFFEFLKWAVLYRQKFIRPLWYLNYSKDDAKGVLTQRLGWKDYGGHHLENRASMFAHTVWWPNRTGDDFRNLTLAARVRSGLMSREEAISEYRTPIPPQPELIEYVRKRAKLTEEEFERALRGPARTFRDFKTYKRRFELMRPFFYVLAKKGLVSMSFYLKYCFPLDERRS